MVGRWPTREDKVPPDLTYPTKQLAKRGLGPDCSAGAVCLLELTGPARWLFSENFLPEWSFDQSPNIIIFMLVQNFAIFFKIGRVFTRNTADKTSRGQFEPPPSILHPPQPFHLSGSKASMYVCSFSTYFTVFVIFQGAANSLWYRGNQSSSPCSCRTLFLLLLFRNHHDQWMNATKTSLITVRVWSIWSLDSWELKIQENIPVVISDCSKSTLFLNYLQ